MATLKAMRVFPGMFSPTAPEAMAAGVAEAALLSCGNRAVDRSVAGRGPARLALVLHLSHLPAPRPHHRRIARAILDDAAQRLQGELFALRNRDVVIVALPARAMEALSAHLLRLFRADVPDPAALLSAWPAGSAAMAAYTAARQHDRPAPELIEKPGRPDAVTETLAVIGAARVTDLTRRQVGVEVMEASDASASPQLQLRRQPKLRPQLKLRPLYAEVMVALSVLRGRLAAVGQAEADPYLFRHLTGQLDDRMLQAVRDAVRQGGAPPLRIHLNLAIDGVLSAEFGRLAAAIAASGGAFGVEIPLLQACGDPAGFVRARASLRDKGVALLLDGVTHHTLAVSNLATLEPDRVKLEWADGMLGHAPALDGLARLGPSRVVLTRVETEGAVTWGLQRGIRVFQGRYVDAMLAAARLQACPAGSGCVLRQCQERAYATGAAGRAGCGNPALLDLGAPP